MKLIIFGASGSGTTTLAQALSKELQWIHLDADDYYWEKSDPPFQHKVPMETRNQTLRRDIESADKLIVSGSLRSWGEYWNTVFDLGVFLFIPPKIRMKRLQQRELNRYGDRLQTDPAIQKKSEAFLNWASQYDDPSFEGRSISQHKQWMKELACPVLRIEGNTSVEERVDLVLNQLQRCS